MRPPQRCMYCQEMADAVVRGDTGKTVFACEEHMAKAIDGMLVPPKVYMHDSHQPIPIKVHWTVE